MDKHIEKLLQAEQEGRLLVLPCAPHAQLYTLERNYFSCESCRYGDETSIDPVTGRRCCSMVGKDGSPHDCPLAVKSHTAEGFTVYITESGKWAISDPGEWNEEGFLPYSMADADGKVYYTKKAAKTALESRKGGDLNV